MKRRFYCRFEVRLGKAAFISAQLPDGSCRKLKLWHALSIQQNSQRTRYFISFVKLGRKTYPCFSIPVLKPNLSTVASLGSPLWGTHPHGLAVFTARFSISNVTP